MDSLDQFSKKKYLNLETFRKNGGSVRTPVWFVQAGETIYVLTGDNSGKVKRIRNNGRVNIVPCKMDGKPDGTWVPADAKEISDVEVSKEVTQLMDRKYGLMRKMFSLGSARYGRQDTLLEIKLTK
jgi:PPOX class probable F420-dependent enzyme